MHIAYRYWICLYWIYTHKVTFLARLLPHTRSIMHLWKECTLPERIWVVFFTGVYLLLLGLNAVSWLTCLTAFLGSVCMFLGAKAKIANFLPGAIYTLLYAW